MSEEVSKKKRPSDRTFYTLPCGLLLKRLMEVEAEAGLDASKQKVDEMVHEWVRVVALELATQIDNPTDPVSEELMDRTDERMEKMRRGGAPEGNQNARGNRGGGAPRGNKNARRRMSDAD